MKKRNFKGLTKRILSLVLCLCTAFGVFALMPGNMVQAADENTAEKKSEDTVQVLRVIDEIKYGGRFTNDKLAVVTVKADAAPEGYISDISELKTKYAAAPLYVGDYVTTAKLLDKKPVDADDDEKVETEKYRKLGYIVITDYKLSSPKEDYADMVNRVIAENPGKTIYFPDGNYNIGKPIVIPADPAKSVALRFSHLATLRAKTDWADKTVAMIRIGVEEDTTTQEEGENPTKELPKMEEADLSSLRSTYVMGGVIYGSGVASGISIEGGKDALLYNVSIKSVASYGIHIHYASNELGATYTNVDNVNITGNDKADCVGVLVDGTHNTFSNMRIASIHTGIKCTETGKNNIFRNLHPLAGTNHGNTTVGFYDMSDGNNYDVCYSDQFETGFVMYENTVGVYNGSFCYWYSERNGYHVGFRSVGNFNSIWVSGKVSQGHEGIATDAYMLVCKDEAGKEILWGPNDETPEDAGQGVVLYPIHGNKSSKYKYIVEYFTRTPIL